MFQKYKKEIERQSVRTKSSHMMRYGHHVHTYLYFICAEPRLIHFHTMQYNSLQGEKNTRKSFYSFIPTWLLILRVIEVVKRELSEVK